MEIAMPHFDAFEDLVGRWRWRLVSEDGRAVATSGESYGTHWHALRAAESVRALAPAAEISGTPSADVVDPLSALVEREVRLGRVGNPSLN
jgi:uncharacterized protein YegP (UPF0339 family)